MCHIKLQNEETDNGGFDRMYNKLGITQANVTQELQKPWDSFHTFCRVADASGMGVKGLS
jgi:hypothetical protein